MIRPEIEVTLIEPLERRTRWLVEQVNELQLQNVAVFTGRAEDYTPRHSFDVVTARAVKALKGLIPMLAPLVVPGGRLALLKGQRLDVEIDDARPIFHRYQIDDAGNVVFAKIVPPTSQNQARIEADLRLLLEQIHRDSDPSIALACERLVRCYDPCISCSTHFLKVKIQRE
jgi:hypothetical protein